MTTLPTLTTDPIETASTQRKVLNEASVARQEAGPWRDDLVASLFAAMLVGGLFLDGWNHINLQNGALGDFFTIWHALLYTGFTATALWVLTRNPHLYSRGSRPKAYFHPVSSRHLARLHPAFAIPLRYPLAVAGFAIAMVGLFGDVVWHSILGEETGVARVIGPFHQLLFAGAIGLVSAPLRSGWYARAYYPRESSFGTILPPLLSLTLATAVAAFMFQWLSVFLDWTPSLQLGQIPPELAQDERVVGVAESAAVARVLVTNVILLAPLLLALKRWSLPFGSATFMFTVVAMLMSALAEFRLGGVILAAFGGGLAADALIRWTRPGRDGRLSFRLVAGLTPIALWSGYFLVLRTLYGTTWAVDLWVGTTSLAAVMGVLLSFVAIGLPATPESGEDRASLSEPRG